MHTFVALNIALMSVSTLFMGLRFYTARFILRHIRADDCKPSYHSYQCPQLILVDMLLAAWVGTAHVALRLGCFAKHLT
jgi:predicted RNA-binding protein with PUA-like domain